MFLVLCHNKNWDARVVKALVTESLNCERVFLGREQEADSCGLDCPSFQRLLENSRSHGYKNGFRKLHQNQPITNRDTRKLSRFVDLQLSHQTRFVIVDRTLG